MSDFLALAALGFILLFVAMIIVLIYLRQTPHYPMPLYGISPIGLSSCMSPVVMPFSGYSQPADRPSLLTPFGSSSFGSSSFKLPFNMLIRKKKSPIVISNKSIAFQEVPPVTAVIDAVVHNENYECKCCVLSDKNYKENARQKELDKQIEELKKKITEIENKKKVQDNNNNNNNKDNNNNDNNKK